MASGVRRKVCGSYTGTAAELDIKTVGFRPKSVMFFTSAGLQAVWTESMADASAHKRIADGTGSFISSQGVTPLANGFRVGTDAAVNGSGVTVHYIAEE